MRRVLACAIGAAVATIVASPTIAQTGNPAADGWSAGGNSMAKDVYIRGNGLFSYTTYATAFTIPSGSPLINTGQGSFTWNAGDTVLGLGGAFVTAPSAPDNGWGSGSAYSAGTINGNITSSLRMLGKFGTSPNPYSAGPPASGAWTTSSLPPASGNGLGSDSSGHGGLGSVLLGNVGGDLFATPSGTLREPAAAATSLYTGSSTLPIDTRVGRMIYIYSGSGTSALVSSWEVLLNVTVLRANYGSFADFPQAFDRGNVAVQRGTGVTHDALVVIPAPAGAALLGLAGLAATRRRR